MTAPERLARDRVDAALAALPGWRRVGNELRVRYRLPTFDAAVALTVRVAAIAEELQHHPEWRVAFRTVDFTTTTHDADGLSQRDLDLAARVVRLADELGAEAREPGAGDG